MLSNSKPVCFIATSNPEKSKDFYQNTLGLRLTEDHQFAIAFDLNGITLRVQKVPELDPPPYTIHGWEVADIDAQLRRMQNAGVVFERYSFLEQSELGIWESDSGTKVAWFKDPDGNTLSITQVA